MRNSISKKGGKAMKKRSGIVPVSLAGAGWAAVALLACGLSTGLLAQSAGSSAATAGKSSSVARGEYIANDVAVCSQCHTPRDGQGRLIQSRWLEGSAVWFQPAAPTSNWPLKAPRLAGSMPASDADMVKLLTTGIWTNGRELRPPMPQFRMNREDAEAVVAYLRSLNPRAEH
jgi:mono/diheme cytochrome c family protein